MKKGTSDVYTDALAIHKNHQAASTWEHNGTHHWHPCMYPGCDWKDSEADHFYRSCVCNVCGYQAPAGTPDSHGGSDSGGGGWTSSTYTVTVEETSHGKVTSNRRAASQGETVTLTVTPDEGYALDALSVTDSRGNEISLTDRGDGKYAFTMPGRAVTVKAAFLRDACAGGANCPSRAFSDLDTGKWYHESVDYALQNGLMSGYGDGLFGPTDYLSRAQLAQILYNREGRPAVTGGSAFTDVADGAWYAAAVTWAAERGIVSGYGNGRFGPDDNITREQLAVMLWRYVGSPAAAETALDFTDADSVSPWARDALCWAVENGVISGKGGGVLDPGGRATRVEAAAMLIRYLGK